MNRELLQRTFDTALQKQKAGELCEAITLYTELLSVFPKSHEIRVNLGVALKEAGDIDAAIAMLREAINIKNDSESAWTNLGIAWRSIGRLDEAIPVMRKAVELNDNSALAWNNLALAQQDAGRMTDAIHCLDRALAIDSKLPAVQSNRLYALHFSDAFNAQRLYDEHSRWAAQYAQLSHLQQF
jgi:tetratricopeptide (TPR) repeat protein